MKSPTPTFRIAFFAVLAVLAVPICVTGADIVAGQVGEPVVQSGLTSARTVRALDASLEHQAGFDHGDPSAFEQSMLELINRARAAPGAEAARLDIDLNQGLEPGTIADTPKPPLSFHPLLIAAARAHSQWMLDTNTFSHTGIDGTDPGDRMENAGYVFSGAWTWGENISWQGSTGPIDVEQRAIALYEGLFLSPLHRANICSETFDEIGLGIVVGAFTSNGTTYTNSVMATQKFARSASTPGPRVLGVVFEDGNGDGLYDVGEGVAGITVTVSDDGWQGTTSNSGGYAAPYGGDSGPLQVTFSGPALPQPVTVQVERTGDNIKIDLETGSIVPIHTITATAGDNGCITPSGQVNVNHGESQTFTISADDHFHIAAVLVDGVNAGAVQTYTFENVTENRTIHALFEIDTYTVTFDPGPYGTRIGGGALLQEVARGSAATAPELEVSQGWVFIGWDADFDAVTGPLTVSAQYRPAILAYRGVNLSGAEFGVWTDSDHDGMDDDFPANIPGTYDEHYRYPDETVIDYFLQNGLLTARLPFRWERLQPDLQEGFDPDELARLHATVESITSKGGQVILDARNYARYYGSPIGSATVTADDFAAFWGALAAEFAGHDRVWFGLMNEPHKIQAETWLAIANAAIHAIRAAGADNLILVPGTNWTSSFSWYHDYGFGVNADVMTGIDDPQDNFAVDVHLYFDGDNSGTTDDVVSPTIGPERLADFVAWCREHGIRGFLGEVGAPPHSDGVTALNNTLQYLETEAADVFLGWTYWTSAPHPAWSVGLRFNILPPDLTSPLPEHRPQMAGLREFLPTVHTVTFDLANRGERIGGGALRQIVADNGYATAPVVAPHDGWIHQGWDLAFEQIDDDLTVTAVYDRVTHTLVVATSHGTADPPAGEHLFDWGTELNCTVDSPDTLGTTRYVSTGWVGSGSVPPSGQQPYTGLFALTEDSSITWTWATEFFLHADVSGNGNLDVDPGWQPEGVVVTITATPDANHRFIAWSGDTDGCSIDGNQIDVPMTKARSIVASFAVIQHLVTFRPGAHGILPDATSGANYTAFVDHGDAPPPEPRVISDVGWTHSAWDWQPAVRGDAPDVVTTDWAATALYVESIGHWALDLTVTGAVPGTLTMGMRSGATDDFDDGMDQEYPWAGASHAWLASDDLSLSYSTDYRGISSRTDFLLIAAASDDADVTVTWPDPQLPPDRYLTAYEVVLENVAPGRGTVPMELVGGTAVNMTGGGELVVPAGETRAYVVRYADHTVFDLALAAGWNMMSLPLTPNDPGVNSVLWGDPEGRFVNGSAVRDGVRGTLENHAAWQWGGQRYESVTEFRACVGYWVHMPETVIRLIRGQPANQTSLDLRRGWNPVGVERASAVPDDPRTTGAVWKWNAVTRQYERADALLPGIGYWINASDGCTIPLVPLLSPPGEL